MRVNGKGKQNGEPDALKGLVAGTLLITTTSAFWATDSAVAPSAMTSRIDAMLGTR